MDGYDGELWTLVYTKVDCEQPAEDGGARGPDYPDQCGWSQAQPH